MRTLRQTIALMVVIVVAACTLPPPHVRVEDDQFSKVATLVGVWAFGDSSGGITRQWLLRSFVAKDTHLAEHQLYIEIGYSGSFRSFLWAADDTARDLRVLRINREKTYCEDHECDYAEWIGIPIDEETLRQRAQTGYRIKVSARSGDAFVVTVSPEMIGLQLAALDQYQHGAPAAAAKR